MKPAAAMLLAALVVGVSSFALRAQTAPAFFIRSLANPADRRESRPELLDTPILPGSIMKTVTLVAALESQVIEPDTARLCRRTVTVGGRTYTCSHPDLKRPLTAAEALAHSCKPNCWIEVDTKSKTIWVRAARSIESGEELTYDYNTEGDKTIPCRCRPGCKTKL